MYHQAPLFLPILCTCAVMAQVDVNFNFNPIPPVHLHSHIFMFGNGSVPVAEGPNPFANNALDGHQFLSQHLEWGEDMIEHRRSVSVWTREANGVDNNILYAFIIIYILYDSYSCINTKINFVAEKIWQPLKLATKNPHLLYFPVKNVYGNRNANAYRGIRA